MLDHYNAIITLGGGSQRGPSPSSLPLHVLRRLELAAFLFKNEKPSSAPPCQIICLSAGTPHRPNFTDTASGFAILESTSAAAYLSSPPHGIPHSAIWRETSSLDTIGNAYFLQTVMLAPAAGRFKRLAVITSAFHMPRTRRQFDWILMTRPLEADPAAPPIEFVLPRDKAAQETSTSSLLFPFTVTLFGTSVAEPHVAPRAAYERVDYFCVSDENTNKDAVLAERIQREAASLAAFETGIKAKLSELRAADPVSFMAAVQNFVMTDHKAYAVHAGMLSFPPREVWEANETY
jgi:hypothetical protein